MPGTAEQFTFITSILAKPAVQWLLLHYTGEETVRHRPRHCSLLLLVSQLSGASASAIVFTGYLVLTWTF